MSDFGQPYRPSGTFGVKDTLTIMILGATVAALGAGLVWLWEISPIPTLLIFTPLFQGFVIGVALTMMVSRLRIRNPLLAGAVGLGCGLLSVGLVHYAHYLKLAANMRAAIAADVRNDPQLTNAQRTAALAKLQSDPTRVVDQVLKAQTGGWGGPIGSMVLRNSHGVTVKHAKVSGWPLWILWGVEASLVAGCAVAFVSAQAASPYCEECQAWCVESKNVALYPPTVADELANAFQQDDLASVISLKAGGQETVAPGMTCVDLHSCPSCGLTFATVVLRIPTKKKNEVKATVKIKRIAISPAVSAAVRAGPPEPPAESPNGSDAPGDPP